MRIFEDNAPLIILLYSIAIISIFVLIYFTVYIIRKKVYEQMIKYGLILFLSVVILGAIGYITVIQPKLSLMDVTYEEEVNLLDLLFVEEADDIVPSEQYLPQKYIKEQWEFSTSVLTIDHVVRDVYSELEPTIVVDRSLPAGEKVQATLYETPFRIKDMSVSNQMELTTFILDDGTFHIEKTMEKQALIFHTFDAPLTVQQFEKDSARQELNEYDMELGTQVLYLRVPKDVVVHATDKSYIYFK